MNALNKRVPFLLFFTDILIFYASLWVTLLIRYQKIPDDSILYSHLVPFSILFIVWLLVFFIGGLYEKRAIILRNGLSSNILKAHITNSIIAVLFFYFIPFYEITPKTNLFIYLSVSLLLIYIWRIWGYSLFGGAKKQQAVLIARGKEMKELYDEVNKHERYSIHFTHQIDLDHIHANEAAELISKEIAAGKVSLLVVDFKHPKIDPLIPVLYDRIFSQIMFVDMHKMYETVFDRIPLSLITQDWFLENISFIPTRAYDTLKRIMDIAIALPLGLISFIVYPFIYIAIKIEDKGPLFFFTERIGKDGESMWIIKFRTMTTAGAGKYDEQGRAYNKVTKIGTFLRKTRLDELPQLINVIQGDISLIGPRPELPVLVAEYQKQIPFYGIRHTIKPGLSGWAQIYHDNHAHHGVGVIETKEKLSYDLYYLKNRSFLLDITIALKTVKKLLSIAGK
ncbi:MAG: sugar transferase [Patescibacteria group bacterium]